jgi:apolipoprotein N-acyltransferase
MASGLALFVAAAMAAFGRWRRGQAAWDVPLFAALWLLAELARGLVLTGFPWVASGYAQIDGPLAPLAPWIGVYGVGAWAAASAAAAAFTTRRRPGPALAAVALLVLPLALKPLSFSQPSGTLAVTLLQTNVPQDEKFAAERLPATMAWTAAALRAAQGDLVIGPETVIPLLPGQLEDFAPGYWDELRSHFGAAGAPAALVGIPLGDFERGYTNSVVGLSSGPPYRYDKQHLVPFGEFIPTGFRWFTDALGIPLGDFTRGVREPPSFPVRGERVAPNICYEDLFGEELAWRFADARSAPTLFANLSNIGWFGDTVAIPQHLNISRFRTLEFERPMIRATNTGATAIVDHRGRVTAMLEPFTRGTLTGRVQGRSGLTPYAAWAAHLGLWPLVLAALVVLGAAAVRRAP